MQVDAEFDGGPSDGISLSLFFFLILPLPPSLPLPHV